MLKYMGLSVAALAAAVAFGAPARNPMKSPNLIIIMTDDHGYADVGFNGSPKVNDIPTPHIDSLAQTGVHFTAGYVPFSVCAPSRAGTLTGRYPQRFGFEGNPAWCPDDEKTGLPPEEETIAEVLAKAGYRSMAIGKWHLGANDVHHPLNNGFDEFFGFRGGGHRYFQKLYKWEDPRKLGEKGVEYDTDIERGLGKTEKIDEYLTDEFSNEAVSFIKKNKERPFFIYLAYNAPHTPLQASPKYLNRFKSIKDQERRTYCAMISAVDDGVGRILNELKQQGIKENTMVFFFSDNGGPAYVPTRNDPLRGHKGARYEGGFRVPFAMQWTGAIKPGQTYDYPVSSMDILPTIAALAGAPLPKRPLDGVNLMPYLDGSNTKPPHEHIFVRVQDLGIAVREGDYKLVKNRVDRDEKRLIAGETSGRVQTELFNLKRDLGEKTDISNQYPEKARELEAIISEWSAGLAPPAWKGTGALNGTRTIDWSD